MENEKGKTKFFSQDNFIHQMQEEFRSQFGDKVTNVSAGDNKSMFCIKCGGQIYVINSRSELEIGTFRMYFTSIDIRKNKSNEKLFRIIFSVGGSRIAFFDLEKGE